MTETDAFEVSLLDANRLSLVPTHNVHSTAFFNISSGGGASTAAGVTFAGTTVTLDISSLAEGTDATLVFDLIGNPPGNSSVATIANVTITPDGVFSDSLTRLSLSGPFGSLVDSAVGDVDGDGNVAVVIVDQSDGRLLVFNGDGARGFARDPISLVLGSGAGALAIAPLTASDSIDDIIGEDAKGTRRKGDGGLF